MKLLDNIKVGLSGEQLRKVVRIDDEDYSIVLQKTKKQLRWQGLPYDDKFLQKGLMALKQYYAVAVLDGSNPHAVSDIVDPFWHSHIICTMQYERFCYETAGYFMHHVPHNEESEEQITALERTYEYTMEIYDTLFHHVDRELNPLVLPRERCICVHFGDENHTNPSPFEPRYDLIKQQELFAH